MRENTDRRIYAIFGSEPEVTAYALAKYSRSDLSMQESLRELDEQKAEKFLNTFYFQYGHRSIADLAHVCIALENISILAAMEVVHESKWDGQERSTRYQNFTKTGYFVPSSIKNSAAEAAYKRLAELLFQEYRESTALLIEHLRAKHARPPEMSEPAYERTLRARAFDSARYLLPLSTVTSVGQIVSARTLEEQIVRLRSHPNEEIQEIGELLKEACNRPAYNPHRETGEALLARTIALSDAEREALSRELLRDVRVAPTLVKYADPSPYLIETYAELGRIAAQLLPAPSAAPVEFSVDLIPDEAPFDEAVNTLLYRVCSHSYREIQAATKALSHSRKEAILHAALERRRAHDELLFELRVGYPFKFDILMDIGAFRDLHRHRRCVQVCQEPTAAHGYEKPPDLVLAGLEKRYDRAMHQAEQLFHRLTGESLQAAPYVLPLGFRRRALFKMDFAEVQYICELRTAPQGHFAYQAAAYQMFLKVREREPELARSIRVHESWFEPDPLRR